MPVHQTVSPRERVGSENKTNFRPRADCPGGHPAPEQNVLGGIWRGGRGGNLFTTAGPLTVSLGLSLAIYCGLWHDDGDARCSTRTHDPVSTSLGDGQPLASHNLSRVKHGWFPNLSGVGGG